MMRMTLIALLLVAGGATAQDTLLVEPESAQTPATPVATDQQPGGFTPIDVRDVSLELDRKLELTIEPELVDPARKADLLVSID